MSILGRLAEAGNAVLNSNAGKLVTNAAAERAASEINKYSSWGQGADTQSPTAPLQPPVQPVAGPAASVTDAAWFWPSVAAATVVVIVVVVRLFGGSKRRK